MLGRMEQKAPWEGVSDAAKREGLYDEHEIMDELVIGPEVLQPPDVAFALRASESKLSSEGCSNAETFVKPKATMCANSDCLQENSQNLVSTNTCRKQLVDKEQHSIKINKKKNDPKLDMSIKEISVTSDQPRQCKVDSSQSFQKQYSTRFKFKQTHSVQKHFTCAICRKNFPEKKDLTNHTKNHTGEQLFRCDICKKEFVSCKNLWNHKQMHAVGDTPYSCDICAKQFSHKSYLNQHKQTHVANKAHPCDVCGKQFLSKYKLSTHKQSHVIEKPYSCKNCKKQFASNNYFIKHIWTCKK